MLILRKQEHIDLTFYIIDYEPQGHSPIFLINWDIVSLREDLEGKLERELFFVYFRKYAQKWGSVERLMVRTEGQKDKILRGFKKLTKEKLLSHLWNSYGPKYVLNFLNKYE